MSHRLIRTFAPFALLLASGLAVSGCTVDDSVDREEVGQQEEALSATLELGETALELDGSPAGVANVVSIDELGALHVSFLAGDAPGVLEHALHELQDPGAAPTAMRVRGVALDTQQIREVELTGCVMQEVTFKPRRSKDGKALLEVTATWVPEDVKYVNGTNGPIGAAPMREVETRLDVAGLPSEDITDFTFSVRRRPTKNYASWSVEGLKVSGSSAYGGDEAAKSLVDSGAVADIDLTIADGANVTTVSTSGKFTTGAESKGEPSAPAQWTLEVLVEGQVVKIQQRA